jgi:hypothetical protein
LGTIETLKLFALAWLAAAAPLAALGEFRSPFLPPAGAQTGAAGPAEAYELAGASMTSEGTQICLFDTAKHHSRWMTVGKMEGGIQVVSYDSERDQAVVKFDGQAHTISLRKVKTGGGAAATFAPVALAGPVGTHQDGAEGAPPVVDPSTIGKSPEVVKQEREARMLVSDLLEISIAQRKAYEEARAKADKAAKKAQ